MFQNSASITEIAKALRNVQNELESVKKDRQGFGYKYADLASCLEAVKEPLYKNGLSITQLPKVVDGKQILTTMLMHESGEYVVGEYLLDGLVQSKMNNCQAMGSALTYARRYSLASMVGLVQEDDDGSSTAPSRIANQGQETPVKQLLELCKKEAIDIKKFTAHFGISSTDLEKVADAVKNFETMAQNFKFDQQKNERQDS